MEWTEEAIRRTLDGALEPRKPAPVSAMERDVIWLSAPPFAMGQVDQIIFAAAELSGFSVAAIKGERRHGPLVRVRHIAYYVARHCTGHSMPKIGRVCRRDHATVMHGVKKVEANKDHFEPELLMLMNRFMGRWEAA